MMTVERLRKIEREARQGVLKGGADLGTVRERIANSALISDWLKRIFLGGNTEIKNRKE